MSTQNLRGYKILTLLGEGTLGTVYRAEDTRCGRLVALRLLTGNVRWDPDLRDQARRHFETVSGLCHPNIAQLYEFGEEGGATFIAAELMDGPDFGGIIADSSVPIEKKIALMRQLAEGLACAHNAGILHFDLKPADIFVSKDDTLKVVDFGVAHVLARGLSRPAVRWGAPIYLAPEQIRDKHYDTRSEIFTTGLLFFELLTGAHPFEDGNSNRVLDNIISDECLPDYEFLQDGPPGLIGIVERCLAKDPRDRFASMAELASACSELLDDIARECQAMLVELQVAVPRLKRAAARPDAPDELRSLISGIQVLAASEQKRDYAALDRLMAELAAQNEVIYCLLKTAGRKRETRSDAESPAWWDSGPMVALEESGDFESPELDDYHPCATPAPPSECAGPRAPETADAEALGLDRHEVEFLQAIPEPEAAPGGAPIGEAALGKQDGAAPVQGPEAVIPGAQRPRFALRQAIWAATAAALVLAVAGAWFVRSRAVAVRAASATASPVALAGGNVVGGVAVGAGDSVIAGSGAADLLVRQAETMVGQGRVAEGRLFLNRALELEPGCASAKALLERLQAEEAGPVSDDAILRRQIADVTSLIAAGQLRKARVEINRIAAASPEHPAIAALRKNWETRSAELARESDRRKAEQADAARRAVADENWSRRTADLLRSGKYAELQRAAEEWLAESPANAQAEGMRTKGAEGQQLIRVIEPAIADKRYPDATVALARLEAINASDPAIPTLRRALEARKAAARANLSVYRLAEAGSILFDGFPIGTGGEIDGVPVAIGEHTIAVKLGSNPAVSVVHDFSDGEKIAFVYDGRNLRSMTGSDGAALASRRAREQVYRVPVVHTHGLLRGSCHGELFVSGVEVRYEPASGTHGFHMPLARLKLKIDGRALELRYASDGASFQSFRTRTPADSETLQRVMTGVGPR